MIEHVWARASQAERISRVVVLTDDQRIADAVTAFGGEVELTPADCPSGTDRIASAAVSWRERVVVNVQGDEPLLEPQLVTRIASHLLDHPAAEMVTAATLAPPEELSDPDKVKVVCDRSGRALYFSRAAIPFQRRADASLVRRHIGIYGYTRDVLLHFAGLEPTPLERCESLEQLRALEHGITIQVLTAEHAPIGVDTAEDLERIEQLVRAQERSAQPAGSVR